MGAPWLQQPLHHPQEGRALPGIVLQIVVVDEQHRVRVRLGRHLEGPADVAVLSEARGPVTVAQAVAVLRHGLIDHVPAGHPAPVAAHDLADVAVVLGGEAGLVQALEIGPPLRVPDQGVAEEAHAVLVGEVGDGVRRGEAQTPARPQDVLHLHLPLGRQLGEVGRGQLRPLGIAEMVGHGRHPDGEGRHVPQRPDRSLDHLGRRRPSVTGGQRQGGGQKRATAEQGLGHGPDGARSGPASPPQSEAHEGGGSGARSRPLRRRAG